jgi:hypothetical protein
MAPEVRETSGTVLTYGPKVDVFSTGLLFSEMVMGKLIPVHLPLPGVLTFVEEGMAVLEPEITPFVKVIERMLKESPEERAMMAEVIEAIDRIAKPT